MFSIGRLLRLSLALTAIFACASAGAQESADSLTVVAGERYEASALQRLFLGRDYRDLWTTPLTVPVLDLDTYAGGLTPVRRGSGLQTVSLRFRAPDGREYNFRSVDKNQSGGLHPDFQGTLISRIAQDQVSSKHPAAALIVTPLLDAVGVLNPGPRIFVMPDDPRLGEFRDTFAGMLGTLEVHPDEGDDDDGLFHGAVRVAGTDRLLEHLEASPENRADPRTYLRARLIDLLVGDWDRHLGQWRWARYDRDGVRWWHAVPEDRDNAFSSFDGLLLRAARTQAPRLVEFGPRYPDLFGMIENSQLLDRWILSRLDRSEFLSVVDDVVRALSDDVLRAAVLSSPPEYMALRGDEMVATLIARREGLRDYATSFYEALAREAEVRGTDEPDRAIIERHPDGSVSVALYPLDDGSSAPFFSRTFNAGETREVRVFLHGDDDEAVIIGSGPAEILIRVIGGGGDDTLTDSTTSGRVALYDDRGDNVFVPSRRTIVDRGTYAPPEQAATGFNENAPAVRDWGGKVSWFEPRVAWRYNIGPVIGGGPRVTRYGFRRAPHASTAGARVLYAPLENRWGIEGDAERRLTNSLDRTSIRAYLTELEIARFHGLGNDTPGDASSETYKVPSFSIGVEPLYHLGLSDEVELFAGPIAIWTSPEPADGSPAALTSIPGADEFWRLGGRIGGAIDARDQPSFPRRGYRFAAQLEAYAPASGIPDPFGGVNVVAAGYLPVPVPLETTLALRAGGRWAWGTFPLQEAAYVGGLGTLRGHRNQRWAGDAAAHAGAEVRTFLSRFNFISRGDLGVILLADAGRVFVDGESPGGWHTGLGGGLWFSILDRTRTLSIVAARGEETTLYLAIGTPY